MEGKRKWMTSCIGLGIYACLMPTLWLLSQLFVWLIPLMSPYANIEVRFQRAHVNGPEPSALGPAKVTGSQCSSVLTEGGSL